MTLIFMETEPAPAVGNNLVDQSGNDLVDESGDFLVWG